MRSLQLFLFLLSLSSPAILAETRLTSTPLRNGLTLVLAPDAGAPKVAVHATFDAGSGRDPVGRDGTAWLANRILAERLPGFEADVTQDRALFSAEVDAEKLPAALRRLAEVLAVSKVPPADFIRLRSTLVTEHGQDLLKPYAAVDSLLLKLTFGSTGYGHPARVAPDRVRRLDVERFLSRHYSPGSAVVVIAGSFDENRVRQIADETLGSVAPGRSRAPCPAAVVAVRGERRRTVHDGRAEAPQVAMAYVTAGASDPDWFALNILADILGQGPRSRLQVALVERKLATSVGEGESESPCVPGVLRIRVRAAPGVGADAVQAVLDHELARLTQELVSEDELRIAHDQERQYATSQAATPASLASAAARVVLFYGGTQRLTSEFMSMVNVTAEDVRRVARQYLRKSARAVVVSLPGHGLHSGVKTP